jgi:glycosyltransferase involved in cell wall biosynthesis
VLKRTQNPAHQELQNKPSLSLIIAFYNNLSFLKLVWASLEVQSLNNFEVIICDDGSKTEVVDELHQLMNISRIPTQHLWHEDSGFRKNRIMNHGIQQAFSDYIVFIDGDCVLHPEFLREHFENKKNKTALAGRRLDLSPGISKNLTPEKIKNGYLQNNLWWIIPLISWRKDNNGPKGIYVRNPKLRKWLNQTPRGIVGCNFSLHKSDLLAVNGFDHRYEAPGTGEDSDLEFRLRLNGVKIEPFCHGAVQYHLWHKLQNRPNENEKLFKEVQNLQQAFTSYGIQQQ